MGGKKISSKNENSGIIGLQYTLKSQAPYCGHRSQILEQGIESLVFLDKP